MGKPIDRNDLTYRIWTGDSTALDDLIQTHKQELCRVIGTMLRKYRLSRRGGRNCNNTFYSEENSVFNNTLLRLVEHIRTNTEAPKDLNLLSYMVVIARNLLLGKRRKQGVERSVGADNLEFVIAGTQPDVIAAERELIEQFLAHIAKWSENRRLLIHLRVEEKLGFTEIGEILGMKPNSARTRYSECLDELRELERTKN